MQAIRILYVSLVVSACVLGLPAQTLFPATEAMLPQHHHESSSGPAYTLDEVEQMALTGNPEIQVAVRQVAVAEAHVPSAGTLDDPMLGFRSWGVPLRQPWNYNAAQNMFMITQTFPGFGKRGLRTEVAKTDVSAAKAALDNVRLDVRVRVRKAFYDLLRAQDELSIHDEHIAIARQAVDAARIKYTVGKVPQQDILKAQVELTKLAEHLVHFEQDSQMAISRLNTLLGRDPASAVSVRGEYKIPPQLPAKETLQKLALTSRPDLAQTQALLQKSREEQELTSRNYSPDFSVSAGYMLMPGGSSFRNNYMLEGSIALPWLNRKKHDAEFNEAKAVVNERDAELFAMRNAAFGQIQEALAQVQGAKKLADLYGSLLRPQAHAALRSTVIAYENDHTDFLNLLDSQTTVVDMDLAYFQAVADFETRYADLELAVGAPIDRSPVENTSEITQ